MSKNTIPDSGAYTLALKESAEQGDPKSQCLLGECYYNGSGIEQNYEEAAFWLKKAADQKYSRAKGILGKCFYYGNGVLQDYSHAAYLFKQAAEEGDSGGEANLGMCYFQGKGIVQDDNLAAFWLKKAVDHGELTAQTNLASCYLNGRGIQKDYEKAEYLYRQAAERGDVEAQRFLGLAYTTRRFGGSKIEQAFFWTKKAAEQGNPDAQSLLSLLYSLGRGVEPDLRQAFYWARKAADQENPGALWNLGSCYEKGYGTKIDYDKAMYYYEKALSLGEYNAQDSIDSLNKKFKYKIHLLINDFKCRFRQLINNLKEYLDIGIFTSYSEEDLAHAVEIDYVLYSEDKSKLLTLKDDIESHLGDCHVLDGTKIICDNAFYIKDFPPPSTIYLPSSIIKVGRDAFKTKFIPAISHLIVPKGSKRKFYKMIPQYKHLITCYSTSFTDSDYDSAEKDEFGVVYDKENVKLLSCDNRDKIEEIIIRKGTKVICDGALRGYLLPPPMAGGFSQLKKVQLPSSLELIGEGAFAFCCSLESIYLPKSIKKIYNGAFRESHLREIVIPSSVDFIGSLAFMDCYYLKRVTFMGCPHFECNDIFYGCPLEFIKIPRGTKAYFDQIFPNYKDIIMES